MKEGELTEKERKWLDKFKTLTKNIPKGIELILTNAGRIDVYPAGTMSGHLGSKNDAFGIGSGNPEVAKTFIMYIKCSLNLIPYSEGNQWINGQHLETSRHGSKKPCLKKVNTMRYLQKSII